ncbi:MAG: PKD domain-containing protein [Bacteroidales bacterium]|jgi:PKD repeat protein|nr:PKD domain-containing protein [Bacteroidales bacterium]
MKNSIQFSFWCVLCAIVMFSCKDRDEEAAPLPVAGFSYEAETANPLVVHFTGTSQNAVSYGWDFGDQSLPSAEKDPIHTYTAAGAYEVTLTVTNRDWKTDKKTQSVEVLAPVVPGAPIEADFSFQAGTNNTLTVQFTDASQNATAFSWNFGDGSALSAERNPEHTYAAGGSYEVTLTVSNNNGDQATKTISITVVQPEGPAAEFTYVADGLQVTFTDASANAESYSWDFGDGTDANTSQNPTHTYAAGGVYTVTLTVERSNGTSNSISYSVTVTDPNAPVPLTVRTSGHSSDLTITPTGDGWQLAITGGGPWFYLDAPEGVHISTATHFILSFDVKVNSNNLANVPVILFLQADGWPNSIIDWDLYNIPNTATSWTTVSIDLTLVRKSSDSQPFPTQFNYIRLQFGKGDSQTTDMEVRNFVARMPAAEENNPVPASIRSTDGNQVTITGNGGTDGWSIEIAANSNDPYFYVDFAPVLWGANHTLSFESKLTEEARLCMYVGRFDGGYYLSEDDTDFTIAASGEWTLHTYDLGDYIHLNGKLTYGPYPPLTWLRLRVGLNNTAKTLNIRNIQMQ